jgi:hypothetical protein
MCFIYNLVSFHDYFSNLAKIVKSIVKHEENLTNINSHNEKDL